ncbi:hypothetical protein PMAYCL1PPCAC_21715 [Pristionchus mayeri]|nr:hypothetical protein PMAYCL1PPCAC_21715 [Pristionchus mayeri]
MEKEGVRIGLLELQAKQFTITSLVSDNDGKIKKMMEDHPRFSQIVHHCDFWHLVKGLNKVLRELAKRKECPNLEYWRRKIVDHCYAMHEKFPDDRNTGLEYMKSALAHVCDRHTHFEKVVSIHIGTCVYSG